MSSYNRFVTPSTTRIEISDGDWIEVKSDLDAGDQRKQDSLAIVPTYVGTRVVDRIDWSQYEFLRTHLWLTDWSLQRPDGTNKLLPVPVTVEALKALDVDTFNEINTTVYKHILSIAELKKSKKRIQKGPSEENSNEGPTST